MGFEGETGGTDVGRLQPPHKTLSVHALHTHTHTYSTHSHTAHTQHTPKPAGRARRPSGLAVGSAGTGTQDTVSAHPTHTHIQHTLTQTHSTHSNLPPSSGERGGGVREADRTRLQPPHNTHCQCTPYIHWRTNTYSTHSHTAHTQHTFKPAGGPDRRGPLPSGLAVGSAGGLRGRG